MMVSKVSQFPEIQRKTLGGEPTVLLLLRLGQTSVKLQLDPSEYPLKIQPKLTSPRFSESSVATFE